MTTKEAVVCRVCTKEVAKYNCPKCELPYCSLACYKEHGNGCVEQFYADQVKEDLQASKVTGFEKKEFEKLLVKSKKLDEEEEDEADYEEFEEEEKMERLKELAEKENLEISDLTEAERRQFEAAVRKGRLCDAWQPWWLSKVLEEDPAAEGEEDVQHICCGPGRKANDTVVYTVVEVLYAYVHTSRHYNGDWAWAKSRAAAQLLAITDALAGTESYKTLEDVTVRVLSNAARLKVGKDVNLACLQDVECILIGGIAFVLKALNEVKQLLEAVPKGVKKALMKLNFLRSFAAFHSDVLDHIRPQLATLAAAKTLAGEYHEKLVKRRDNDGILLPHQDENSAEGPVLS